LALPKSHGTYLSGKQVSTPLSCSFACPRNNSFFLLQINIPVLNHTLNLPPHRQKHQNQPVNNQHRPEDGQVEDLAPAAQESNANGARGGVPELELREAAHEGLEFLVALGG
jgi:hypothetical protein